MSTSVTQGWVAAVEQALKLAPTPANDQTLTAIGNTALQDGINPNIAVADANQESGVSNTAIGDNGNSVGLFQLNSNGGEGTGMTVAQRENPTTNSQVALSNFESVAKTNPSLQTTNPGLLAYTAQRPSASVKTSYINNVNATTAMLNQAAPLNGSDITAPSSSPASLGTAPAGLTWQDIGGILNTGLFGIPGDIAGAGGAAGKAVGGAAGVVGGAVSGASSSVAGGIASGITGAFESVLTQMKNDMTGYLLPFIIGGILIIIGLFAMGLSAANSASKSPVGRSAATIATAAM